jgi:hypothetical protein
MPSPENEFQPLFEKTPQCLPLEVLAFGGSDARRHLESCAWCRNELAMFQMFETAEPTAIEAPSVEWIADRLRTPRPSASAPRRRAWDWMPRWLPVAAAACLVIAVGSGIYWQTRPRPSLATPSNGADVWRSAAVRLTSPLGDVTTPPRELAWSQVDGATVYHVRLLEVDRHELWSADTPDTHIALPAAIAGQLQPGRSFEWDVAARNPAGAVAESNLQKFHIVAKLP